MAAAPSTKANQLHDSSDYQAFLAQRRAEILSRIEAACARAGRNPADVSVVAVSKTVDVPAVVDAYAVGYRDFGENRPQELRRKAEALAQEARLSDVRLHMIGNLQKNKINQVLESNVCLVHSLANRELVRAVSRRAEARQMRVCGLLEVNVVSEASKAGMAVDEVRSTLEESLALPGLDICGLMAMAPAGDVDAARRSFSGLRALRDELEAATGVELSVLSCGMSGDFEIAVEEGSTLVRLGRVIFDPAFELA